MNKNHLKLQVYQFIFEIFKVGEKIKQCLFFSHGLNFHFFGTKMNQVGALTWGIVLIHFWTKKMKIEPVGKKTNIV